MSLCIYFPLSIDIKANKKLKEKSFFLWRGGAVSQLQIPQEEPESHHRSSGQATNPGVVTTKTDCSKNIQDFFFFFNLISLHAETCNCRNTR